jgi:hypothetical protein
MPAEEKLDALVARITPENRHPEIDARRRAGLPDYEKPPLGQPPSWLQEQERKVDPGPAIGEIDARTIQTTEAHPTMELRFVRRHVGFEPVEPRAALSPVQAKIRTILQQRWGVITFNHLSQPIKRESEWRDVPLVEE